MPECEHDDCPCHSPAVDMPPHVLARLDQTIARLTDESCQAPDVQ